MEQNNPYKPKAQTIISSDAIRWSMISNEQNKRIKDLMKRPDVKQLQVFSVEDVLFYGNRMEAALSFVESTEYPADFFVFVQNNYKPVIK